MTNAELILKLVEMLLDSEKKSEAIDSNKENSKTEN